MYDEFGVLIGFIITIAFLVRFFQMAGNVAELAATLRRIEGHLAASKIQQPPALARPPALPDRMPLSPLNLNS